jgi:prophage regulatory protein
MQNSTSHVGGLPLDGYIRQGQLIPGILPFSSPTLWRMVKSGNFPRPVKLSPRVTAWRVEDVRAWMMARDGAKPEAKSAPRTGSGRRKPAGAEIERG